MSKMMMTSDDQLAASQAREQKLRKQLQRVVGSHNSPNDCYATGPLTGNDVEDLVSCPSCEAEVLLTLPTDDSALQARLKEEREKCAVECEQHGPTIGRIFASKIRSMK